MKVAFITDGNNQLGMGHVYQSLTLASLLSETVPEIDISFLTKSDAPVTDLISKSWPIQSYSDDTAILEALKLISPGKIIFDKLDVSPDLASKIKQSLSAKLIIFTNLTKANDFADMTVLADIGSNFKNIRSKDPVSGKASFWGTRYWLLRPEFYRLKEKGKASSGEIRNITLIFGGADPCNYSTGVLSALLNSKHTFHICLILGSAFNNNDELNEVLANADISSSVEVLRKAENVGEIMFNSDLVFASPGLSFFEALAVGTPVIGFHQNQLQADVYKSCFNTYGVEDVYKVIDLIEAKQFIYPEDKFIQSLQIGEGKDELLAEILN
jgi:spore coat polysaccharide biosynthesis predicted glycosyltransferase SpsG